jgi:hypothetical protein
MKYKKIREGVRREDPRAPQPANGSCSMDATDPNRSRFDPINSPISNLSNPLPHMHALCRALKPSISNQKLSKPQPKQDRSLSR